MIMPFIKVYIHFVWTTKKFQPLLIGKPLREKVRIHILENAQKKGIFIKYLAVQKEHCHCLISLEKDQTISSIIQLIKGESSFWINSEKLIQKKFSWQSEYYGISISESHLPSVKAYILNQDVHHRENSFLEEYEDLIIKHGFEKMKE
jgi:putative transposase